MRRLPERVRIYCHGEQVTALENPDGSFRCACCGDRVSVVVVNVARYAWAAA